MRVIGGRCKGRRLAPLKGDSTRPTSDKVREAVYNILPMDFPFESVLDLFAGTGAMGIEAMSRGASRAVFVEKDPVAATVIRKNLEICGLSGEVIKKDVLAALSFLARKGEAFDLVIIDPPYAAGLLGKTLKAIDEKDLLSAGGYIVAEASKRAPLEEAAFANIELFDERRYGDTVVYFLRSRKRTDG